MKHRNGLSVLASLTLVLVLLLISACIRDPYYPLRIQNQTDQTLTIFYVYADAWAQRHIDNLGSVAPGGEVKREVFVDIDYHVEAKNAQDDLVFSRVYTRQQLRDMRWKIVIPPLQKEVPSSANITGK